MNNIEDIDCRNQSTESIPIDKREEKTVPVQSTERFNGKKSPFETW